MKTPERLGKPRPLSALPHGDDDGDGHHADADDDCARASVRLQVAPTPTPRGAKAPTTPPPPTTTTTTTTTTLDAAFSKHVGELGPAQLRLCLLGSVSWATLAMGVLSLVFLTPDPVRSGEWACVDDAQGGGACAALKAQQQQQQQAASSATPGPADPPPFLLTAQSPAFCALPRDSWRWADPRKSAVAAFDLQCDRSALATAASSALFVGFLLASPWWGGLADRNGRRVAALLSGWAAALASLLSAAAPNYPALLLARALLGAGVAGLPVALYPLCVEIAGPRARGRAGVLSQAVYHVGEWVLPLLAWWLADWRMLCLAIALSAALSTLLIHSVPESPRWLLVRGRELEARRVLQQLARGNGRAAEALPRLGLYASGGGGGGGDGALTSAGGNKEDDDLHEGGRGISELWRHRRSRGFLLAVSASTGVAAAGFYVCSLVDALPGSLALTFFLTSAAELPFALALAHWIDAWGRKPAVVALLAGGGLAAAVCGASPASYPALQLASATVAKGAISAAWGGLVTWSAELFSTSLRAQALAVSNQSARLGGVIAPVVAHWAARRGWPEGQFFLAGVGAMAAAGVVWLSLPETRGVAQPDKLADVDAIFGGGGDGEGMAAGMTPFTTPQRPRTAVAGVGASGGGGGAEGRSTGGGSAVAMVARPSSTDSARSGGWAPLLLSPQQHQQHVGAMAAAGKEAGVAAGRVLG